MIQVYKYKERKSWEIKSEWSNFTRNIEFANELDDAYRFDDWWGIVASDVCNTISRTTRLLGHDENLEINIYNAINNNILSIILRIFSLWFRSTVKSIAAG